MNLQNVQALVEQVAQAVMQLRVTLENHELPGLEAAIVNSQMALKGLEAHPGGVEGLRQLITTFPADAQKQLNDRLEEARSNHQLNSDLIRLGAQRCAVFCGRHLLQRGRCVLHGRRAVAGQVLIQAQGLNVQQRANGDHRLCMQLADAPRR